MWKVTGLSMYGKLQDSLKARSVAGIRGVKSMLTLKKFMLRMLSMLYDGSPLFFQHELKSCIYMLLSGYADRTEDGVTLSSTKRYFK